MCGRFIDPNLRGTDVEFAELKITPFSRRYNVRPTDPVLVFGAERHDPMLARWGLVPSWYRGELADWRAASFNARIEDARSKPTFRGAWRYGRCLIPIGGFYEWTGPKGARQPHFICSAGNSETLWLAGLISLWHELLSCTILTRAANGAMVDLHDRMPVILNPEERDAWIRGSEEISIGAGALLHHYPVRPFGATADGPELIEPM